MADEERGPGDVVNVGPDDRFVVAVPESVETAAWYPLPDGKGRPEAVVMLFHVPELSPAPVLVRFKGTETLDKLIDSLARLRNEVFGVRGLPPHNAGRNRPRRPGQKG